MDVLSPPIDHPTPCRCGWRGMAGDALYTCYHDTEWGVPERDGRALWEKLVLDGFQAGLSWITILRRRDSFRAAFADFDPEAVARFGDTDRARLLGDAGIIRSAAKIDAAIRGARLYCDMGEEAFARLIWAAVDGAPRQNRWAAMGDVPAATPESTALAKQLKGLGFGFCGPVIVYAFMQACGLVNDHLTCCFRHVEVRAMAESWPRFAPPSAR